MVKQAGPSLSAAVALQPAEVKVCLAFGFNPNYTLQFRQIPFIFGKIHFAIHTNTFHIWTNTYSNSDKHILDLDNTFFNSAKYISQLPEVKVSCIWIQSKFYFAIQTSTFYICTKNIS